MSRILSLILCLCLATADLLAEELTLNQTLLHGIENSTLAFSLKREMTERISQSRDIQLLQNPRIQVDPLLFEKEGSRAFDVEFTQPLRLSDFSARPALADAMNELSDIEERRLVLELIHSLTDQYIHVWMVQEHERIVKDNLQFAKRTNKQLKQALREGQLQPAETYLFDAETEQLEEELQELSLELGLLKTRFLQELGIAEKIGELKAPEVLQLTNSFDPSQGDATSLRERLQKHQLMLDKKLRVVELDSILPEISPRLLYERGISDNSHAAGIGFALTIPLWDRKSGEQSRIRLEQQFIKRSIRNLESVGFDELVRSHFERASVSARRAKKYLTAIVPKYKKALDATEAMLSSGQTSVMQLWLIHERLHEAEQRALEAVDAAFRARAELEIVTGKRIEE